jgi:hypothetical protein
LALVTAVPVGATGPGAVVTPEATPPCALTKPAARTGRAKSVVNFIMMV